MQKYTARPGDKPFLLDPAKLEAIKGIPIKTVELDGSLDQLKSLLQDPEDEPRDFVISKHAQTGETLISLESAGTQGPCPAILLIGHDQPIVGRVILISRPGLSSIALLAERTSFLINDTLTVSSVFKGKRRWRPQPAKKYGTDAADILKFLNSAYVDRES